MRNQGLVFLGLFLITFGLYASQLKKKAITEKSRLTTLLAPAPTAKPQTRIQVLYEIVSSQKYFSNRISGIRLTPTHAQVKNDFTITYSGEEIFSDEGFSIHESLRTSLDSLVEIMKAQHGLKVEISGYADADNPKEKKPSDYGSSALTFSFARAEWLAHYFERKHGILISKYFILRGMGAVPQGKKIELRFFYGSSLTSDISGED